MVIAVQGLGLEPETTQTVTYLEDKAQARQEVIVLL